ncbi:Suppressor of G2 allele of SKP1 [Branchiostoma belcheri]|nr:Suppressor of G2 allele of SKP1 [Branchiostoma belcheri]
MAAEVFGQANEAFVDENYEKAVELYTKAIELDGEKSEYFTKRAQTYIKLEQYMDAVTDATKAVELEPSSSKAHLRKGVASFYLDEFESARESFVKGQELDSSEPLFVRWIRKCDANLNLEEKEESGTVAEDGKPLVGAAGDSSPTPQPVNQPQPQAAAPPPVSKRHDWYQTETHVIVTVMIKGMKKEDVQVDYDTTTLSAVFKQPSGTDYVLDLDLAHPIVKEQCITKVLSTKVEMKMKKSEGIRWQCLEGDGRPYQYAQWTSGNEGASGVTQYPSSSHFKRDWNKIVADVNKEEKEEKTEGDAALNQFFQQIYSDGNEEVRKAMNKSFVESGGTVLSTNWKDIGKKKVDMKPPDGMEFKKWEI